MSPAQTEAAPGIASPTPDDGPAPPRSQPRSPSQPLRYFLFAPEGDAPADITEAVALRSQQWNSSLKPWDAFECWIVDQVAYQSINLERCALMADALARHRARRAELAWDLDRRAEVADLGAKLASRPAEVSRRLRRSLQGADWLLVRWRGLAFVLEKAGRWDSPQRSLALDLLGTPPEVRGDDGRAWLPDDPAALADLVRSEVAELEALKSRALAARDADDRAAAIAGTSYDDSPEARSLRRYESSCRRALEWAKSQLKRGRHDLDSPPPARPSRPRADEAPAPPPLVPAPIPMPSSPAPPARDPAPAPARRPGAPPPPINRRARRALEKLARRAG